MRTLAAAAVWACIVGVAAPAPAAAAGIGDVAPVFVLPTAGGEMVALDKLRGQVVYVDFWASWCGPCRRSFPWMNEMQRKYGARGLTIVGINVDRKRADAAHFLEQTPATFTVLYDEAGVTPAAFAVKGMPSSYLIDGEGKVVEAENGFRDDRRGPLEERIQSLLARR